MNEPLPEQLRHRILALLDGTLDRDEAARLDAELLANREARDLFRQFAMLHSALEVQGASKSEFGRALIPMERLLSDQRRAMIRNSLFAAAAVLVISAVVLWMRMAPRVPAAVAEFRLGPGTEFLLSHAEEDAPVPGLVLREGSRLRVMRGTIETNFESGVRGIIEAPAELLVSARDHVVMKEGVAWFEVPPPAVGFTAETPQLIVVDLGTEFGVISRPDDPDEVHVTKGSVMVKTARAGDDAQALKLAKGQACRLAAGGGFDEIEIKAGRFLTVLPEAITYIDADIDPPFGNTVLDGGGSFGPATLDVSPNDGKWSVRTLAVGNHGDVLASHTKENASPRLATRFALPGPGRYAIYGYFWNNLGGRGNWDAEFQLGIDRPPDVRTKDNATNLSQTVGRFTNPGVVVDDGSGQVLFEARLGVWDTETDGFTVTVFVDDPKLGTGEERTWYDGVGFRSLEADLLHR